MTPSARLAAAASVLDSIQHSRAPAETVLKAWGQSNRYAGSKDRRAIADRVYRVLRAQGRLEWAMGRKDGRALVLGSLALIDGLSLPEIEALHTGEGYGPAPLSKGERARLTAPPGELPGWVAAGLPAFAAEDLKARLGDGWTAEAEALLLPRAPIDLRVNGALASVEDVEAELRAAGLSPERTPWSAWGLRLPAEPPPNVQALDAFRAGRVEIQDEGSQIACWLAGARPGMLVVDYCAGGGGKTLGLAQQLFPSPLGGEGGSRSETDEGARSAASPSTELALNPPPHPSGSAAHLLPRGEKGSAGPSRLIACDVVQKRLDNIRPRLQRAGVDAELRRLGHEGQGAEDLLGQADLVLVDAPCSGSGTWRRRPEDAWRLDEAEVQRLHRLQVDILARAARLVKPGGRLVYVTCSILTAENEASADAFEAAHPDFRPSPIAEALDSPNVTDAARERLSALASGHRLRLSPAATRTDGFFMSAYKKDPLTS